MRQTTAVLLRVLQPSHLAQVQLEESHGGETPGEDAGGRSEERTKDYVCDTASEPAAPEYLQHDSARSDEQVSIP